MWEDPETDGTIIFESYKHHSSSAAHKLGSEDQNGESVGITKENGNNLGHSTHQVQGDS